MLELKDIKKSYLVGESEQQVLKGIDIKFRKNEFVSILGASGSGKTTLLNIIGGLDKYDDGNLIIEGTSTKKYTDRDWDAYRNYRVGFIFQTYNLIMHQTVLANVEIALTLSGVSKHARKKKAIEALTRVGLKDHINKRPNQLSGGQMQRVAIARALVNDPEIILADEPTGALDSKTSIQIMDLLKDIAKDKLVIMVTHNPELAKEYSTRIIELKDGKIMNDNNPFNGKEKESSTKKIKKTSMTLLTSLSLSFNNLLTKKGRTFLTAFAGSIGIIGIALILSLSNGVNKYAKDLEKDSLSDYPINIERTSYDIFGAISQSLGEESDGLKDKCDKNKICSKDDIVKESVVSVSKGLVNKNNLVELKKYIEANKDFKKYTAEIKYEYNFDLQVYTKDYQKVNPSDLKEAEITIFNELPTSTKKYKLLAGILPNNNNEMVLVLNKERFVNDSILYALGIKSKENLQKDLQEIRKDNKYRVKSTKLSYDKVLNKEYKLILNTDYYLEDKGQFIDYSNNSLYMKDKIDKGIDLKIVGIVEDKDATDSSIGYRHGLKEDIINKMSKTSIYQKQIANKDVNVLTNTQFDDIIDSYDAIQQKLGTYELTDPSTISLYPKDYDSKQQIVKLIEKYNKEKKDNKEDDLVVTYSDVMKSIVGGITKVINIVSYVLIAFIAISLIVSSIMIAIITYISVLERTKEIGILRAIGASKKDIKRVFYAETIIEGLIAGILGVVIAFLICSLINVIVSFLAKIDGIARMSAINAIILILLSVGLNVLAGARPASMAAKKDPVESLRSE